MQHLPKNLSAKDTGVIDAEKNIPASLKLQHLVKKYPSFAESECHLQQLHSANIRVSTGLLEGSIRCASKIPENNTFAENQLYDQQLIVSFPGLHRTA